MEIGLVVGSVVSTQKESSLVGCKFLIVKNVDSDGNSSGKERVAIDVLGAGKGELVLLSSGSAARTFLDNPKTPIDLAVVGIIDSVEK